MKVQFYLVVSRTGKVRTVKTKPALDWDEVSIRQDIELPDSLFTKPSFTASIVVNEDQVGPRDISPEIQDNIKGAIEAAAGVMVKIQFPEQDGGE